MHPYGSILVTCAIAKFVIMAPWAPAGRTKLLHVMVLLRLGLVRKKVLLFVNSIDAGFRLRLFLEAFGIRAAVLNAELPLNSRHHILQVCPCSSTSAFSHCMYRSDCSNM